MRTRPIRGMAPRRASHWFRREAGQVGVPCRGVPRVGGHTTRCWCRSGVRARSCARSARSRARGRGVRGPGWFAWGPAACPPQSPGERRGIEHHHGVAHVEQREAQVGLAAHPAEHPARPQYPARLGEQGVLECGRPCPRSRRSPGSGRVGRAVSNVDATAGGCSPSGSSGGRPRARCAPSTRSQETHVCTYLKGTLWRWVADSASRRRRPRARAGTSDEHSTGSVP